MSQRRNLDEGGDVRSRARSVLLLDDEPMLLTLWSRALERAGYAVTPCSNAAEALVAAKGEGRSFDAAVCDVYLSADFGPNVIRELRQLSRCKEMVVVYSSGYPESVLPPESLQRDGFLAKPFTPSALIAAVARRLEGQPPPNERFHEGAG